MRLYELKAYTDWQQQRNDEIESLIICETYKEAFSTGIAYKTC